MCCTFGVFKLSNLPRKALTFQVPAKGPTVGRSKHCRQGSRFVMGCTVDSLVVTGTVVNSEPTLEHLMGSGIVTVHPLEYHIQTCVQDISRLSKAFRDFSETMKCCDLPTELPTLKQLSSQSSNVPRTCQLVARRDLPVLLGLDHRAICWAVLERCQIFEFNFLRFQLMPFKLFVREGIARSWSN